MHVYARTLQACVLAPRGRWDNDDDLRQDGLTEMLWATLDEDEDGLDAMAASLNKRVGNLPQVCMERNNMSRSRTDMEEIRNVCETRHVCEVRNVCENEQCV
jgi:hypothetical protein